MIGTETPAHHGHVIPHMKHWIRQILFGAMVVTGLLLIARPAPALSFGEARHLLARTGFGLPAPAEISEIKGYDRATAVDHLLDTVRHGPLVSPPAWIEEHAPPAKQRKTWTHQAKQAFNKRNRERWRELQHWWTREMLETPSPLTERLVLFWHNHFTSSFDAVKWVPYLYAQNAQFRRHGMGDFKTLLRAMVTDPAMLFFLDGRRNRSKSPNENFARELLELFTLGEGRGYTERDIQEAARALSGWSVKPETSKPVLWPKHHDAGEKTIFGQRGYFGADDVVSIILRQPAVARHLAERFHAAFIGGQADAVTINAAAAAFRQSGYRIRTLIRSLLLSDAFWALENRGTMIKSPVDLVVGLGRLSGWQGEMKLLVNRMSGMGQKLLRPPNVKGWPGGLAWITSVSLTARGGFVYSMTKVLGRSGGSGGNMMANAMGNGMQAIMAGPKRAPAETAAIVLAVPPVRPVALDKLSPAAHLTALFRDPAFQMK